MTLSYLLSVNRMAPPPALWRRGRISPVGYWPPAFSAALDTQKYQTLRDGNSIRRDYWKHGNESRQQHTQPFEIRNPNADAAEVCGKPDTPLMLVPRLVPFEKKATAQPRRVNTLAAVEPYPRKEHL